MALQREHGAEHPCWPLGPFKIRLPFIHYRWEFPEMIQGLIMFVVSLGMIPLLFATGPGSEIQKPLAIVVTGGLVSATLLTLLLLIVVLSRVNLRRYHAERLQQELQHQAPMQQDRPSLVHRVRQRQ
mgnify:CR=1 FL=1